MATLTKEQIEQKMQQLKQLAGEFSALTKELVEAGVLKLSEEDLEKVSGGKDKQEPLSMWDKYLAHEFAMIDKKRKK